MRMKMMTSAGQILMLKMMDLIGAMHNLLQLEESIQPIMCTTMDQNLMTDLRKQMDITIKSILLSELKSALVKHEKMPCVDLSNRNLMESMYLNDQGPDLLDLFQIIR